MASYYILGMLLCRIHSPVCYQVYLLGFCTFLPTCLFQWQYFSISMNRRRAFSIFCNIQIYPYISSNILVATNLCTLYDKNTIATFILVVTKWYLNIDNYKSSWSHKISTWAGRLVTAPRFNGRWAIYCTIITTIFRWRVVALSRSCLCRFATGHRTFRPLGPITPIAI